MTHFFFTIFDTLFDPVHCRRRRLAHLSIEIEWADGFSGRLLSPPLALALSLACPIGPHRPMFINLITTSELWKCFRYEINALFVQRLMYKLKNLWVLSIKNTHKQSNDSRETTGGLENENDTVCLRWLRWINDFFRSITPRETVCVRLRTEQFNSQALEKNTKLLRIESSGGLAVWLVSVQVEIFHSLSLFSFTALGVILTQNSAESEMMTVLWPNKMRRWWRGEWANEEWLKTFRRVFSLHFSKTVKARDEITTFPFTAKAATSREEGENFHSEEL